MMCSALRASVAGVFPWDGWSSGDNRTDDHLKDLLEILFLRVISCTVTKTAWGGGLIEG